MSAFSRFVISKEGGYYSELTNTMLWAPPWSPFLISVSLKAELWLPCAAPFTLGSVSVMLFGACDQFPAACKSRPFFQPGLHVGGSSLVKPDSTPSSKSHLPFAFQFPTHTWYCQFFFPLCLIALHCPLSPLLKDLKVQLNSWFFYPALFNNPDVLCVSGYYCSHWARSKPKKSPLLFLVFSFTSLELTFI